jgi:hypothetical protein
MLKVVEDGSRYEGEVIWKGKFSCMWHRGIPRQYVRDSESVTNGKGKLRKYEVYGDGESWCSV